MNLSNAPQVKPRFGKADVKKEIDLLLKEYGMNLTDHRQVWRSYVQSFVLVLTAIFASVLGVLWKGLPETRPFLAFVPFVISAWFTMIGLQMLELTGRASYLGLLEMRIRVLMKTNSPCWEGSFRSIIYSGWRYLLMLGFVAVPILSLYGFCVWQGSKWLTNYWLMQHYGLKWGHFITFYACWAVLAVWVVWTSYVNIRKQEKHLKTAWKI
jgi:hypothetical protein